MTAFCVQYGRMAFNTTCGSDFHELTAHWDNAEGDVNATVGPEKMRST